MEVDTKPSYRNHIANVNTYFNSLCQIVSHHYKITKKENGVITREMAKVPSFSLMDESTLVTGLMIKETVELFLLGLKVVDMRELVQKSCSTHS